MHAAGDFINAFVKDRPFPSTDGNELSRMRRVTVWAMRPRPWLFIEAD